MKLKKKLISIVFLIFLIVVNDIEAKNRRNGNSSSSSRNNGHRRKITKCHWRNFFKCGDLLKQFTAFPGGTGIQTTVEDFDQFCVYVTYKSFKPKLDLKLQALIA